MEKENEIILFETEDKEIKLSVPVDVEQETVWLNEKSNPPAMLGRIV